MSDGNALMCFAAALSPLVLTPGASFTLVTARSVRGERLGAVLVVVGTALGIASHAAIAGIGLSAIVLRSAQLYEALRWAGALYLVVTGLLLLRRGCRRGRESAAPTRDGDSNRPGPSSRPWTALVQGYVANVLNVKAVLVYLTLAPQFIPAHDIGLVSLERLAMIHIAVMSAWLLCWILGVDLLLRVVGRRIRWYWLDRVGGVTLVTLGMRAAANR